MKKKLLYIITFLFAAAYSLEAQTDVSFKTICKRQVSVGEQFQVSYELNADGKDFKAPNFNNFEIIGGPFKSTSSSVQIINGSVSKTNIQTYENFEYIKNLPFLLSIKIEDLSFKLFLK